MANNYLGVGLSLLSMLLFSIAYAFFKACGPYIPNTLVIFFVSLFAWFMLLPAVCKSGSAILKTHRLPVIALRTIFGLISFICITYAFKTVSLSEVILLNNTSPLFVPLIAWIWHRGKISSQIWLGLIVGFVGVFVIFRPSFHIFEPGLVAALLSGLSSGALLVATRQIAHEPFLRILFYYFLIFIVCMAPFLFTDWTSPPYWVWVFCLLAAAALIGAQLGLTAAMRRAPAHEVAPFVYTSVIFTGLLDWAFWHDIPSTLSIIGMAIVCIGGLITMIRRKA